MSGGHHSFSVLPVRAVKDGYSSTASGGCPFLDSSQQCYWENSFEDSLLNEFENTPQGSMDHTLPTTDSLRAEIDFNFFLNDVAYVT